MIVVYGKKVVELAPILTQCDSCREDQNHQVFLEYSFAGAGGIFNLVTDEKYTLVCGKCKKQFPGDLAYFKAEFPDPLPFRERYGCLAFSFAFLLPIFILIIVSLSLRR